LAIVDSTTDNISKRTKGAKPELDKRLRVWMRSILPPKLSRLKAHAVKPAADSWRKDLRFQVWNGQNQRSLKFFGEQWLAIVSPLASKSLSP
jgi:hypothetical protein